MKKNISILGAIILMVTLMVSINIAGTGISGAKTKNVYIRYIDANNAIIMEKKIGEFKVTEEYGDSAKKRDGNKYSSNAKYYNVLFPVRYEPKVDNGGTYKNGYKYSDLKNSDLIESYIMTVDADGETKTGFNFKRTDTGSKKNTFNNVVKKYGRYIGVASNGAKHTYAIFKMDVSKNGVSGPIVNPTTDTTSNNDNTTGEEVRIIRHYVDYDNVPEPLFGGKTIEETITPDEKGYYVLNADDFNGKNISSDEEKEIFDNYDCKRISVATDTSYNRGLNRVLRIKASQVKDNTINVQIRCRANASKDPVTVNNDNNSNNSGFGESVEVETTYVDKSNGEVLYKKIENLFPVNGKYVLYYKDFDGSNPTKEEKEKVFNNYNTHTVLAEGNSLAYQSGKKYAFSPSQISGGDINVSVKCELRGEKLVKPSVKVSSVNGGFKYTVDFGAGYEDFQVAYTTTNNGKYEKHKSINNSNKSGTITGLIKGKAYYVSVYGETKDSKNKTQCFSEPVRVVAGGSSLSTSSSKTSSSSTKKVTYVNPKFKSIKVVSEDMYKVKIRVDYDCDDRSKSGVLYVGNTKKDSSYLYRAPVYSITKKKGIGYKYLSIEKSNTSKKCEFVMECVFPDGTTGKAKQTLDIKARG